MKVLTVVGARPQFVKAASVSRVLRSAGHQEYLVHTGQHYDYLMSQVFFDELGLGAPEMNLAIGSGPHGRQTGQMLERLEAVMQAQAPDWVLTYGDTNSTLAAALAACKLRLPLAHVEAGLRSFNRDMPEEHNRVVADHVADLLLCPTRTAVGNLTREGVTRGVHLVGDTMYEAILLFGKVARQRSGILERLDLRPEEFYLATIHRPYNTDVPANLAGILAALSGLPRPVVLPVHPRTRTKLAEAGIAPGGAVHMIDPVGYLDMLALEQAAKVILTDSGGVQKEAFFFGVPCVTLRTETEWVETVELGWNLVVGADSTRIVAAAAHFETRPAAVECPFGDGHTAERISRLLVSR
jgi:UDP-N-acetylglucosamine 2-epimerase